MSAEGADLSTHARWRQLVFPADHVNPTVRHRYHLAVIGAGPAGLVTAIAAAGLGARVALLEREAMGGDCLNVGCVPSKALLEYTRRRRGAEHADAALRWLREVRASIAEHDSVARYRAAGVDVFLGEGRFVDPRQIEVAGQTIRARRFVIATGARAALPAIPGLAQAEPLTNATIFDLAELPASLIIIGGGPIGCELAQGLARLGVGINLLEAAPRILPGEHPEAGRLVAAALEADGVQLRTGVKITAVSRDAGGVAVRCGDAWLRATEALVAAGRQPNTESLNLDAAGVRLDSSGRVAVDHRLRTSNRRIFAAGDVCSALQFTHTADAHARIVVQNTLFAATASTRRLVIPRCIYTQPELASVGQAAIRPGTDVSCYRVDFAALDRGQAEGDAIGFAEVVTAGRSDRILAATIVGQDAGEQIAPLCLAMSRRLGLGSLAGTVLPYPTRAEYLRRLADASNRTRLTPWLKRVFAWWFRWTR